MLGLFILTKLCPINNWGDFVFGVGGKTTLKVARDIHSING
jgi:hypothetical protein